MSNLQLSRMRIVADIVNILEGLVFMVLLLTLSVLLEASHPWGKEGGGGGLHTNLGPPLKFNQK